MPEPDWTIRQRVENPVLLGTIALAGFGGAAASTFVGVSATGVLIWGAIIAVLTGLLSFLVLPPRASAYPENRWVAGSRSAAIGAMFLIIAIIFRVVS